MSRTIWAISLDGNLGALIDVQPSLTQLGLDPTDSVCGPVVCSRYDPLCPFKLGDVMWSMAGNRIRSFDEATAVARRLAMEGAVQVEVQVMRAVNEHYNLVTLPLVKRRVITAPDGTVWSTPNFGEHVFGCACVCVCQYSLLLPAPILIHLICPRAFLAEPDAPASPGSQRDMMVALVKRMFRAREPAEEKAPSSPALNTRGRKVSVVEFPIRQIRKPFRFVCSLWFVSCLFKSITVRALFYIVQNGVHQMLLGG